MSDHSEASAHERANFARAVAALLHQRARGFRNQHILFAMSAQLNRIALDEIKAEEAARSRHQQAIERQRLAQSIESRLPIVKVVSSR